MANTLNIIPSYYAAGSYTANNPFDAVVKAGTYYTVNAIRSVAEMQGMNLNLYTLLFEPAGVSEDDYQSILDDVTTKGGAIITLIALDGSRVYVPTTYLATFPLVDGVSYERLCLIADCGAVPPTLKDNVEDIKAHIEQYIAAHMGVTATVQIGTMPTIGYVSKEQADVFETTRQNTIADQKSDVVLVAEYEDTIAKQAAYIATLEAALQAKAEDDTSSNTTEPTDTTDSLSTDNPNP